MRIMQWSHLKRQVVYSRPQNQISSKSRVKRRYTLINWLIDQFSLLNVNYYYIYIIHIKIHLQQLTLTIINHLTYQVKVLLLRVKNAMLQFENVQLEAIGSAIGKCCSACKLLEQEGFILIEKMETDLIGEEKTKPKVTIMVKKVK